MFKCGFYEKEITPPLGCFLPGYFNLRQGSNVKDRLYARAAVIDNGNTKVAFISVDTCALTDKGKLKRIKNRIFEYTKIPEENILIGATHSHTAIPYLGYNRDENAMENQKGYWEVAEKLIADCAILADIRLKEAELSFGEGEVEGISFCRNYIMKNSTPRTNPGRLNPDIIKPAAEIERKLPVLFAADSEGVPFGAIVNFSCHADCVDGTEYSGDYVSELSIQLKKEFGPDFVTVFLQGASGDINHFDVNKESDSPDHYRMMGRKIAEEAVRLSKTAKAAASCDIKVSFEYLNLKRREISDEAIAEAKYIVENVEEKKGTKIAADNTAPDQYNLMMAKSLLRFVENTPEEMTLPLQYINIGGVGFYAIPSEIFNKFGQMLREDEDKCFVAGLANGCFEYIPTEDMFFDTIYEARPGANILEKRAGYKIVEKLKSMQI